MMRGAGVEEWEVDTVWQDKREKKRMGEAVMESTEIRWCDEEMGCGENSDGGDTCESEKEREHTGNIRADRGGNAFIRSYGS